VLELLNNEECAMRNGTMTPVDELLAPFEARATTTREAEADRRRDGLRFGWELNRLQGGVRTAVSERLEELYAQGKINDTEYLALSVELAKQGHLGRKEDGLDGR
jgi:hypothetical protein